MESITREISNLGNHYELPRLKRWINDYVQEFVDRITDDNDTGIDINLEDLDETTDEIFNHLFNSDESSFAEYRDYMDFTTHEFFLMIKYFNTYYKENFGSESIVFDLSIKKTIDHYALAYAFENNLKEKILNELKESIGLNE